MLNGALLIFITVWQPILFDRESIEAKKSLLRDWMVRLNCPLSGITSGLTFKLCGAIGFIIKLWFSGVNMGPSQLSE
jgi:hypothetical protein